MGKRKLRARLPALPGKEFFAQAQHSIRTQDGSALLTYDPQTRSGFVYYIETGQWTICAPVDFVTFALHARMAGHTIGDSPDVARWLRACSPNPAGGTVVDLHPLTRH